MSMFSNNIGLLSATRGSLWMFTLSTRRAICELLNSSIIEDASNCSCCVDEKRLGNFSIISYHIDVHYFDVYYALVLKKDCLDGKYATTHFYNYFHFFLKTIVLSKDKSDFSQGLFFEWTDLDEMLFAIVSGTFSLNNALDMSSQFCTKLFL